jgi:hypothetical protein
MSKMAELSMEIQCMLSRGYPPETIANLLEIPISWIFEEMSPFETINS